MNVLEKLRLSAPGIHAQIVRKGAGVAATKDRQALAFGMRLRAVIQAVDALRRDDTVSLGIVGDRDFAEILLASGVLDHFSELVLYETLPGVPLPGSGRGLVPSRSLASTGQSRALLVLDETLVMEPHPCTRLVPAMSAEQIPFGVPEAWRPFYEEALAGYLAQVEQVLAGLAPERTVLFAGIYSYFNCCKLSVVLRRQGFSTVFLCLNPSNQAHKKVFFDAVLDARGNLEFFYSVLASYPFLIVHFQGWLGLHCFAAAAATLSMSRVITEFNDLPQFCFTDKEFDLLFGQGAADQEKRAIRQVLARSKAVVLNYQEGSVNILVNDAPVAPPILHLHSYPLPDFFADAPSASNAGRTLVFCGTLNPSYYPAPAFGDVQLLALIRELMSQGIAFHVFPNPYQAIGQEGVFWDYEYLARQSPFFMLHQGVRPESLSQTISGMGWGAMLYRFPADCTVRKEHLTHMLPTKFFSYLEAGLPVVVSESIGAVARIVEEHGLGLVIAREKLARLGTLLEAADYEACRANVRRYRHAEALDGKVKQLTSYYAA